jgi:hypothetical protein
MEAMTPSDIQARNENETCVSCGTQLLKDRWPITLICTIVGLRRTISRETKDDGTIITVREYPRTCVSAACVEKVVSDPSWERLDFEKRKERAQKIEEFRKAHDERWEEMNREVLATRDALIKRADETSKRVEELVGYTSRSFEEEAAKPGPRAQEMLLAKLLEGPSDELCVAVRDMLAAEAELREAPVTSVEPFKLPPELERED